MLYIYWKLFLSSVLYMSFPPYNLIGIIEYCLTEFNVLISLQRHQNTDILSKQANNYCGLWLLARLSWFSGDLQ